MLRHRRVALNFYLGILVITSLTVVTGWIGLASFQDSRHSLDLTVQSMPFVATASRLANMSETLEAQGIFLVTAESQPTRVTARIHLDDQIQLLRNQLDQFSDAVADSPEMENRISDLQRLIDQLTEIVGEIDNAVNEHLIIEKDLLKQVNSALGLMNTIGHDDFRATRPDGAAADWQAILVHVLALATADAQDVYDLAQRNRRMRVLLETVETRISQLDGPDLPKIRELSQAVRRVVAGEKGIFYVRNRAFSLELSVTGKLALAQAISRQINAGANALVDFLGRASARSSRHAADTLETSGQILLWTVGGAIVIALLYFVVIQRLVFARLLKLQRNMIRHVSGERPEIQESGEDEIHQMADAFKVFVDKRHKAEAELTAAREVAIRANTSKTKFLAAASHDLRQPLQAATLFVASLLQSERDPARHQTLDLLNQSIQTLRDLLDSILEISRLESGSITPSVATVDVTLLLRRLASEFEVLARRKGLEFELELDEALVKCDAHLLERILRNLVDNAIKYTAEGSVHLRLATQGKHVVLEVRDTGIGIAPAEQQMIFNEFHQVGNEARDRGRGLGLGLSIVRHLCVIMYIQLELDSVVGEGSCFRLKMQPARVQSDAKAIVRTPTGDSLDGHSVIVIEDDRQVLEATSNLLSSWGMVVHESDDPDDDNPAYQEMIAGLAEPPSLILADYRLPRGQNGVAAINALRFHFNAAIPAILITGEAELELNENGRPFTGQVLRKPVDPERLKRKIVDLLCTEPAN